MKKVVGFIGIRESGPNGIIENTGNFLHGHAARQIVSDHIDITKLNTSPEYLADLRQRITHLGFVAATTIPVNRDPAFTENHPVMAKFIEALGLPVVVFGLGAQAPLNLPVSQAQVNEKTLRLVKTLSDHSESIAVRGAFTGELLNHYGIKNVDVVGCQSCYFSRRPDFTFPTINLDADPARTLVSVTKATPDLSIIKEAIAGGSTFIGQSSHFEYLLKNIDLCDSLDDLPEAAMKRLPTDLEGLFRTGKLDFNAYHRWIKAKFHQFYNMPEWFDFIRGNFDLAIGTRFHGNMSAMLSGVPALWLVHDRRTQEFCDLLGLPNASLDKVRKGVPIHELIGEHLDSTQFNKVYPTNYARFYNYLERQGVAHRLGAPT
jgi:hypothetical protein